MCLCISCVCVGLAYSVCRICDVWFCMYVRCCLSRCVGVVTLILNGGRGAFGFDQIVIGSFSQLLNVDEGVRK